MVIAIIVLALVILAIFGIGYIADANAHARQAEATIQVAKVAQTQAWTNLFSVMILALLILVIVLAIGAVLFLMIRYRQIQAQGSTQIVRRPRARSSRPALSFPELGVEEEDVDPTEIELVRRIFLDW